MKKQNPLLNQEGFTLVEIIAVLIILGILAAVAVPRYLDLEAESKIRGADAALSELNGRESITWANDKITGDGYSGDATVFGNMDKSLGEGYTAVNLVTTGNSSFTFKGVTFSLSRVPSSIGTPAFWVKKGTNW